MTTKTQDAMIWMNQHFGADIDAVLAGTPIPKNLLIAIGIQETYYIWAKLYKTATPEDVLAICVGDTIDSPKRNKAWPKNRAELEQHPQGKAMFKVARAALVRLAKVNSGFSGSSFKCNTYGPRGIGCCDETAIQAPRQRGTWRDFGRASAGQQSAGSRVAPRPRGQHDRAGTGAGAAGRCAL